MKIMQLSDELANKIAAGEVVERPASVVKELVENSIDAKSTSIKVELKEAGLEQIKIIDNGIGMSEQDCEKSLLRHATSKIKNEADLFHVRTLGFRGEALASIAAVSKLQLQSSQGGVAGTKITVEGGNVISREKSDARKGTEITVDSLFYNTPARLKYMKTIHTELGHITDLLNRLALANPTIRFEAIHNDRQLFKTAGTGDVQQVIANIYGMNVARQMLAVEAKTLDFEIEGFISKPELTRASRSFISTIINGRYIRSHALNHAITRAYHTLLPIHRLPIVVLSIKMDPILVDVNVHPTKLEVRFSKEKELFATIEKLIKEKFQQTTLIPEISKQNIGQPEIVQNTISFNEQNYEAIQQTDQEQFASIIDHEPPHYTNTRTEVNEEPAIDNSSIEQQQAQENRIPALYPIGQLHGTYILAQNESGLYMIDQHAAQERIKYEEFKNVLGNPINSAQELLLPITFDFSRQEALLISENIEQLKRIGLQLDEFGEQSYIIRSHPTWFPKGYEEEVIRDIIEQIIEEDLVNIEKIREEAAILMACKGSIKANHYLNETDMRHLLEELRQTSDPFTCPHGRPVIVHITSYELEKMFKRVM